MFPLSPLCLLPATVLGVAVSLHPLLPGSPAQAPPDPSVPALEWLPTVDAQQRSWVPRHPYCTAPPQQRSWVPRHPYCTAPPQPHHTRVKSPFIRFSSEVPLECMFPAKTLTDTPPFYCTVIFHFFQLSPAEFLTKGILGAWSILRGEMNLQIKHKT